MFPLSVTGKVSSRQNHLKLHVHVSAVFVLSHLPHCEKRGFGGGGVSIYIHIHICVYIYVYIYIFDVKYLRNSPIGNFQRLLERSRSWPLKIHFFDWLATIRLTCRDVLNERLSLTIETEGIQSM